MEPPYAPGPPPPMYTTIGAGDLVSTAARAVSANFVAFVVIALLCVLPSLATSIAQQELMLASYGDPSPVDIVNDPYGGGPYDSFGVFGDPLYWLTLVLGLVGGYVATAGIMYGTVEWMAGRRATIGGVLTQTLSRIGPVLGVSLLTTIATGAGLMMCVVPGIIIWLVFAAAVPATVVERLGPVEAMKRSAELTEGHKLQLFVAMLAAVAIYIMFSCCFGGVLVGGGVAATIPSGDPSAVSSVPIRIGTYVFQCVQNVVTLLGNSSICAVFYARIRGIRDGVDANALADVFS